METEEVQLFDILTMRYLDHLFDLLREDHEQLKYTIWSLVFSAAPMLYLDAQTNDLLGQVWFDIHYNRVDAAHEKLTFLYLGAEI